MIHHFSKPIITTLVLFISIFVRGQIEIPARLSDRSELIIKHCGYTVSYNTSHGTPNWSAWVLTKTHVQHSSVERSNTFLADPLIPFKYRVAPSDYQGSGYDRGHMCPAADMQWSTITMKESFYMTNMCPQVPALNRVSWKALETQCRSWVMTEDTLYIVCGPVYRAQVSRIKSRVDIPTGFFKVILSLKKNHKKAIGFYYVNSSAKQSLSTTATTVDQIEHLTGIDFFYMLDDKLEEKLESKCRLNDWH